MSIYNHKTKIIWICPECEKETEVTVSPVIPAQLYGPPENCYPSEGGEIEPDICEHCNCKIPQDEAIELATEVEKEAKEAYADYKYDEWKDEH